MDKISVISSTMNNKKIYLFIIGLFSVCFCNAQITGTYQIKGADTVKIFKVGGSINPNATELILMNNSDTVPGFLWNNGLGVTKFKRPLTKINSTTYLVGVDTLYIGAGGGGSPGGNTNDIQFNQAGSFAGVDIFYYDSTKKTLVSGSFNAINTAATYSAVFGQSNTLTGINGFVVGTGNTAGVNSFAFGLNNNVNSYSISVGGNNAKTSTFSGTIGQGLLNTYQNSLLIGQYNDTIPWSNAGNSTRQDTIPIFSIGNGANNSARANIFSILRNGTLRLNLKNNSTLDSALAVDQRGNIIQKFFTTGGGGGGISTAGLTMPGGFIVSNSPLSGSGGTIAVSTTLSGVIHGSGGAFSASQIVDADVANVNWSKITSTPTTVTGYGITNAVRTDITYSDPTWLTGLNWSKIISPPTTLAGYGITDPVVLTSGSYSNPSWITTLAWSKITSTPTTLSGYGITDAVPSSRTLTINGVTFDLTANRSWTVSGGSGTYAALTDVNLTSLANGQLTQWNSGTSKWVNFTPTYISGNQSITLSGDASGTGATSIAVTLATVNANVFASNTPLKFSVNGKGLVTGAAALVASDLNTIYGYTPINPNGTTSQYFRGDGSLATFPTIPAQFNPIGGTNITLSGTYPNITFNATGTGVTNFSAGNLSPLFTTSVATSTSTPALSFSLSTSTAWTIFGNGTGSTATGTFFSPVLASGLFNNQGTTVTVLHGNASGNPSWGAVNFATDMTGNIQITNIASGTGASSATYLRGDNTWATLPATVTTPPNIGTGLRVYSPQVPGFKSFIFQAPLVGDTTTTTNVITVHADTTTAISGLATKADLINLGTQNIYAQNGVKTLNDSTFGIGGPLTQNDTISGSNAFRLVLDSFAIASGHGFKINFGSDAGWDLFTKDSATGYWTRIPKGTVGQSLQMLGSGGIGWAAQSGSGGIGGGIGIDSVQSYTSGTTLTQTSGYNYIQVNPSAVQATLTITTATTFHSSNDLYIVFGGSVTSTNPVITSFNLTAGSGLTLVQAVNPNGMTYNAGEVIHYHKIGSFLYRIN